MPNRYRRPLKLLTFQAWHPLGFMQMDWMAACPMVVDWPGGKRQYVFSIPHFSAN